MRYVAEGDSITVGAPVTTSYSDYSVADSPYVLSYNKVAVTGSLLDPDLIARESTVDALATSTKNILSVMATSGIISDAQWLNKYITYLDGRRAAGYGRIIVCTITPRDSPVEFEAARLAMNINIRALVGVHCDYVCDFAADPIMGVLAAASDTALYSGGIHPTADEGHGHLRTVFLPIFNQACASFG